ncbi:MAG TPA: hypothetical protein DDZ71_08895, partial [Sulfuricurvum sp.]|nr:hypothetical protein [Sulfuricurvum sp.]
VTTQIVDNSQPGTPEGPNGPEDTVYAIISGPGATTEGDVTGNFTVSLVDMNGNPVTPTQDTDVTVVFSNGTAETGDYVATTQIVTILANSANATFTVQTNEDVDYDNETFVATIQSVEDTGEFEAVAVHATSGNVTATITDDDTAPSISINDVTVNEDAGTMSFTVSLSHATTAPVSFNYASANNAPISAAAGSDYTAVSGSGSIATGATTTTITVPISDDFLKEGNETFLMNLSNVSANVASSGNDLQGVGTITDAGSINPPTPEVPTSNDTVYVRLVNSDTVTETGGDGALNHRIELVDSNGNLVTVPTGGSVTVSLLYSVDTTTSGDYSAARTTSVTITAGSSGVDISNAILNDLVYEGSEGYTLRIGTITQSGDKFEAVAQHTTSNSVTGTITDAEDMPVLSVNNVSVAENGGYAVFTVSLSNQSASATTVNLSLTNGTAVSPQDYTTNLQVSTDGGTTWMSATSATIAAGSTSVLVRVPVVDDTLDENSETFTLTATRTAGSTSNASATGTATITDNDSAPIVSSVISDDDYVNENTDANSTNNIVQNGTIQNVGAADTVVLSGNASGITSNNQAVTYTWNAATKTLTASSSEGTVFTVTVNADNTGYTFTQLRGIDHLPTVQGEGESKVLNFDMSVVGGISTAPFTVTVYDDAPSVSGDRTITTENDGDYSEIGYLSQATVSNDITSVVWNTSTLPDLVFDGKPVYYVDQGNGTLSGQLADGTLIFRVTIDPNTVDANNHPQYSFELLNTLGRLGQEGAASTYTVISGGNIDHLDLAFGNFLIDSMNATISDGSVSTVNTNNNWIGVGGNWFNTGDKLEMTFTDPSGAYGQVRGMDMVVEGQGSAAYTLSWTVTAAINAAGDTITYSGSMNGTGNTDVPFTIPLQNGALYFTSLEISDASSGDFRIAFSAITANDYYSDIPMSFDYSLVDADGDTAAGQIDVTLTAPTTDSAPKAVNDTATTNEDTPIVTGDLKTNDTISLDGGNVWSLATQAVHGTAVVNADGTYTYTPVANWNGTDSFTYTITDLDGDTSSATVTITVAPVNDAPTSTNDAITILEDLNNTTNVYTVSVNDFGTYNDADNNSLSSIRIDSLPTNGTLYLNGTAVLVGTVIPVASITSGLLTFDPINHTDADSSFTFSVNDGTVWSASSYTTTVAITAIADTPIVDIAGTGVVTQVINIANVSTNTNGFTISALNPDGSTGVISTHTTPDGFGVTGVASGDNTEIGYLNGTGSEKLVVQFDNAVSSVDVSFAWKHSYGTGETALIEFYNNGVLVGTRTYNGGTDSVDPAITLQPNEGGVFDEIRFGAVGSGDDYLIHSISFEKTASSTTTITTDDNRSVDLDASSALVDTDGSETLNTTISGIPAGYTLTDGTNTFTASAGSTVANVTGWNLAAVSLEVPTVTVQTTVTLTITATATETSNGSSASASDTIAIVVVPHNDAPVFANAAVSVNVSEEGLAGGLADTTGTSDTTNATTATGTFNITDVDSASVSVTLTAPTTTLTSDGVTITWSGAGTNTLVGSANGSNVMTISIDNSGNYTVNLSGPVDHATVGVEDVNSFSVGVTASDGSALSTGALTINIEDDAPVTSAQTNTVNVAQIDTNVMIVLDVSGSMTSGSVDRLAAAKTAISNLINAYDNYGDVAVKIVTFSTTATDRYSVWMSASDAIALLAGITAGGMTNYDSSLAQAMDAWKTAGKLTIDSGHTVQNVVYFMSDGQPNENDGNTSVLANNANGTSGGADAGIQTAEETTWTTFLNNGDIKAYALGIGDGLSATDMAYLDPIAYNGVTGTNDSSLAILVPDVSQLTQVLLSTIDPIATGNVLTSATPGAVGADGGYVGVITVGTGAAQTTFTWNTTANTVASSGSGTNTATYNSTTHVLSVTTANGGLYVIDLDSGDYTYTPPMSISGTVTEVFGFTLIDNDGDSSTGQITLNVNVNPGTATTTGTANADTTLSGSGNDDIISGLAGNDTISGNAGNDWISGGAGTDVLNGGDGNDKLDGGAGADALYGGAGNDLLISDLQTDSATGTTLSGDTGLGKVDGGDGFDTFLMSMDGSAINFAALNSTNNPIKNIEVIDLGANGAADNHQLTNIRLQDVIDMTDVDNDLYILGDSSDSVSLDSISGQPWSLSGTSSEMINGQQHMFNVYSNSGDSTVVVKVEDSVSVSIV